MIIDYQLSPRSRGGHGGSGAEGRRILALTNFSPKIIPREFPMLTISPAYARYQTREYIGPYIVSIGLYFLYPFYPFLWVLIGSYIAI